MRRTGNDKTTLANLAKDDSGNVLQVASYNTGSYQNLDGTSASDISTVYATNTVVRIKSYETDNWITISNDDSPAVADIGMLLETSEEITVLIYAGNKIATIGGKLNIVSINN